MPGVGSLHPRNGPAKLWAEFSILGPERGGFLVRTADSRSPSLMPGRTAGRRLRCSPRSAGVCRSRWHSTARRCTGQWSGWTSSRRCWRPSSGSPRRCNWPVGLGPVRVDTARDVQALAQRAQGLAVPGPLLVERGRLLAVPQPGHTGAGGSAGTAGRWRRRPGHAGPDRIHRVLNRIDWDAEEVLDDAREYVVEYLGDREAVLILDDAGF